jgi:hypothetical protein
MILSELSLKSLIEMLNVRFKFDGRRYSHFHHVSSKMVLDAYSHKMIFFVSTGRSGSAFISHLLGGIKGLEVYHEPYPCLAEFPNLFDSQSKGFSQGVLMGARSQRIIECFNRGNRYIESNQIMSLLIRDLSKCFPNSKIVHIVRSPFSFVKSSLQKGWYLNDTVWEYGRIKMECDLWASMSQVQKLTWYWSEVNGRVLSEISDCDLEGKFLSLRLEDLKQNIQQEKLANFIGVETKSLTKVRSRPVNKAKKSEWWSGDNINKMKNKSVDISEIRECLHKDFKMLLRKYNYD